jgi:hypothetical protein
MLIYSDGFKSTGFYVVPCVRSVTGKLQISVYMVGCGAIVMTVCQR